MEDIERCWMLLLLNKNCQRVRQGLRKVPSSEEPRNSLLQVLFYDGPSIQEKLAGEAVRPRAWTFIPLIALSVSASSGIYTCRSLSSSEMIGVRWLQKSRTGGWCIPQKKKEKKVFDHLGLCICFREEGCAIIFLYLQPAKSLSFLYRAWHVPAAASEGLMLYHEITDAAGKFRAYQFVPLPSKASCRDAQNFSYSM